MKRILHLILVGAMAGGGFVPAAALDTRGASVAGKPDICIGRQHNPSKGNNIYNITGAGQTVSVSLSPGFSQTVFIEIQNDGDMPDAFLLKGTKSTPAFKIQYYLKEAPISKLVKTGAYVSPSVASGTSVTIKAVVTAAATAANQQQVFSITAKSSSDSTAKDRGVIRAFSGGD